MNKRIAIVIDNSNTIQFKTDLPTIYQGSSNSCYLDFEFASTLPTNSTVQIMFRRSDGKTTALLPTITQGDGIYTFYLNSDWYTEAVGQLTFTVRVTQVVGEISNIFATSTGNLTITATPDGLFTPAPVTPSAYDLINASINEINTELEDIQTSIDGIPTQINDKFNEVNPVDSVSKSLITPTVDKAHIKATYYNGTTQDIDIDLPSGLATETEVDTKIEQELTELNPVTNITESTTQMQIKVTKKDGIETNVNLTLPQDLVSYSALEEVDTPQLEIYHSQTSTLADTATKAINDVDNNPIKTTYAKVSTLSNVATSGNYNDLLNKPVVDTTPVNDSGNLITSGAVYTINANLSSKISDAFIDLELPANFEAGTSLASYISSHQPTGKTFKAFYFEAVADLSGNVYCNGIIRNVNDTLNYYPAIGALDAEGQKFGSFIVTYSTTTGLTFSGSVTTLEGSNNTVTGFSTSSITGTTEITIRKMYGIL